MESIDFNGSTFFSKGSPDKGISPELSEKINVMMTEYKKKIYHATLARMNEWISVLIKHENLPEDFQQNKVEYGLFNDMNLAFGKNKDGDDELLGLITNNLTETNPLTLFQTRRLQKGDIQFFIPKERQLPYYNEIVNTKNGGNFVVLRNKPISYMSDRNLFQAYSTKLAELSTTRFSLVVQAKVLTLFFSEVGDETINQAITALYNNHTSFKVGQFFDKDSIVQLNNAGIASLFPALYQEYKQTYAEFLEYLGVSAIGITKEAGVSIAEIQSSDGLVSINAELHLQGRNQAYKLYNSVYGTDYKAVYTHDKQEEQEGEEDGEVHHNSDGDNPNPSTDE